MSLATRLNALVQSIGADVKDLRRIGPNNGVVNAKALTRFHAKLGASTVAPVKIITYGDSVTEGASATHFETTWPYRLQTILRARKGLPAGGKGFVGLSPTPNASIPTSVTGNYARNTNSWGLGGRSVSIHLADHYVQTGYTTCDRIRVWYGTTNIYGGQFKVLIDGVDQGIILNSSGTANGDGHVWDSGPILRANRFVKLIPMNGWIGLPHAVEFFDGDWANNIRVYNAGTSGFRADLYTTTNMSLHWSVANAIDADLAIIMLGINDLALNGLTGEQFLANMITMIGKMKANTPVLIVWPWMRADLRGELPDLRWLVFRDVLRSYAISNPNVAFLNMQDYWPSMTSNSATWAGLMSDGIHPLNGGMDLLAETVAQAISGPVYYG